MLHQHLSYLLIACLLISTATANEQALLSLINRLNSDVIELRNEVELHYQNRCDAILGCTYASYDECLSEFTSGQSCPTKDQLGYAVEECGAGVNCNGLFDYTSTTVRLPNVTVKDPDGDRNPKNPLVIEAICASRKAEGWMVKKYQKDKAFWKSLGVASPQMYIGSQTGMFRIFPGRQSRECGSYDPRERPWYKGAVPNTISSAAPRHVVFLLDKSLSMGEPMGPYSNATKLDYMKQVVTSTLSFLTDRDSVAVITFAESAHVRGHSGLTPPYYWKPANMTNIEELINEVNALQPSGRSNWVEGFDETFDLIDNSLKQIALDTKDDCKVENVGLLFFSDGDMNMPGGITNGEVTSLVASRIQSAEAISVTGDFQIHPFLYSIANDSPKQVSKEISCAADGIWKPLYADTGIQNVTMGYETLFSTPMGDEAHQNFTTWSDPYTFTSSGETGYTVSALLYDRAVAPPRFIGAVGIDFLLSAAAKIYQASEEETIKAIKRLTTYIAETNFAMTCEQQKINLTYCEVQSLRYFSGGNDAICIPPSLQDDQGGLDIAKLEAYLLEQNTAEAYTSSLSDTETIDLPVGNETATIVSGNGTTNVTLQFQNETATIVSESETTNVTLQNETITFDIGMNQSDAEVTYHAMQSLSDLSTHTLLENLNCSNAFVFPCPGMDEYPSNLWNNLNLKGKPFEDRTCCKVGTGELSDQCPKLDEIAFGFSDREIFAFIIVPLAIIELCGCYFCFIRKRMRKQEEQDEEQ